MSRFKGICFAIEDEATKVVEVPVEEVGVPAEVVAEVAEVEEAEATGSEMQAAADEAGEDLETLEEVRDVLADSVEAGEGVDQPAAAIAEIAVESICRRLGMKKVSFIPAMESFGSKNNRVAATRIAVEGIMETLKAGWAKLVEWLKKTFEQIKAFFVKLFDANLRLQKAAEEMKGKVAALSAEAKAEGDKAQIENKALAASFGAKGVEATLKGLAEITSGCATAFNKAIDDVSVLEKMGTDLGTKNMVEDTTSIAMVSVDQFETALSKAPGAEKIGNAKNGITIKIAGYKIGFAGNASEGYAGLQLVWEKAEAPATKIKTLDKAEMTAAVAGVEQLCKDTAAYKEVYGKMEKINKISIATVENVLKSLEKLSKAGDSESKNTAKVAELRKKLTKTNSILSSLGSKLPSLNVSTGKSALEYVAASLKQHKAD